MSWNYAAGQIYIYRINKTRWILETWGDFSVTLKSEDDGKYIYPSHEAFRRDFT